VGKLIEIEGPDRVYFIRMNDLIKIGYTAALKQRVAAIQDNMPYPVELLFSVPGDRFNEAYHHWLFRDLHHQGEWFRAEPALLEYIERLKKEQSEREQIGHNVYLVNRT
jgi:hypothetical protein